MSDPDPSAEDSIPTTVTNISGDVVGRDKTTIVNRGGRAHIAGNVTVSTGGAFVGRDRNGDLLKVGALKIGE